MRYRQTGKRRITQSAWKAEECIYCPLRKPIAWPIVFLLFAFSPFIFANPALNKASLSSQETHQPTIQAPNSQEVEIALPNNPTHISSSISSGK